MEDRIHLADPAPPYCAACYQAVPHKRHVDFGAGTDGPVMPPAEVMARNTVTGELEATRTIGTVGHSVDEIVICETCVAAAAKLLGMGAADELLDEIEKLRAANDALHTQLTGQRQTVTDALDGLRRHVETGTPIPGLPNSSLPLARPVTERPRKRSRA